MKYYLQPFVSPSGFPRVHATLHSSQSNLPTYKRSIIIGPPGVGYDLHTLKVAVANNSFKYDPLHSRLVVTLSYRDSENERGVLDSHL